ncbi:N-acetylmuramoyl-L-alanine amidase [Neobacillus cucumis]|uniref:N-acetylmuramoyl-L-alanine amidase n=1 Tax=Neobacillus cucumis TaxID=1740721 RepID=UPI0018DFEF30|nr:N-acetylmuramoyl-L-alanine amidase [Neobacillus cucumis]MBI0578578.1 N-acetylmuramoyl-L-alanine amidase [Neobacillus cucumis]
MKINQKFIPASNTFTRPGIKMNPEYITIHETDNTARGADDFAHANLQYNGNTRQASWHFTVDDDSIYQSIPTDEVAWHAGDGDGPGNMSSIAIEICVNRDGDFTNAVENAAWLTKHLMGELRIPISNVVQHHHWSGKNCPRYLRSGEKGVDWNDFLAMVKGEKINKSDTPKKVSKEEYKGDSIVDYLNSLGEDSSFSNREKLAAKYGIGNYKGTAEQNLKLLDILRGRKSKTGSSDKGYKGNSIVDYLNSIGEDSSFSNRAKLAEQYGIKNYTGTAAQNLKLLDILKR